MRSKRWPLPSRTHIRTRRNEARPVGEDAGPVPPDGGSEVGSVGGWVKTRAQGGGFVEEKRSRRSAGHHRLSPRPRPGSRGEPRDTPVPGPASRDPALVGPMPPPRRVQCWSRACLLAQESGLNRNAYQTLRLAQGRAPPTSSRERDIHGKPRQRIRPLRPALRRAAESRGDSAQGYGTEGAGGRKPRERSGKKRVSDSPPHRLRLRRHSLVSASERPRPHSITNGRRRVVVAE